MKSVDRIIFCIFAIFTYALNATAATFSFIYTDPAGFGFNDNTPVSPIGGNTGTTLGEQRRFLLEFAANTWATYLVSDIEIVIQADFEQIGGSPNSATLAFAGPEGLFTIVDPPTTNTLYVSALADSLSGQNQDVSSADILVTVNESVDSNPNVLGGGGFYYGVDNETPLTQADLLSTLLHEIAHGLGFLSTVNLSTGALSGGIPDSFTRRIYDQETGQFWTEMNNSGRLASATNDPNLVFKGPATTEAAKRQLKTVNGVNITLIDSQGLAVDSFVGVLADFGLGLPPWGIKGALVLVDDGVDTTSDGCESSFVNAEEIRGRIALIDRGNCNFDIKVKNAQDAGAIAVIVVNNESTGIITMAGNDESISLPSMFVSIESGTTLRNMLPDALVDLQNLGAGAGTQNGTVRLHAPATISFGSSVSHWAGATAPDLLMEPNISDARLPNLDLSVLALRDIGWNMRNIDIPYFNYSLWADESITNSTDAANEDADGDFATNLEEYAAATDPMDSSSIPTKIHFKSASSAVNTFELDYLRNRLAADIVFDVETTTDLNTAFESAINGVDFIQFNKVKLGEELEQAELNITNTENRGFYRISLELFIPAP